ncbi:MAG: HAD-IA family hydrolase [Bryobacteraceae bacterium]|nr:HAD-IA family hydrolase [Bryobacteraceae bacterium]MCX7603550.1 HAD-IA family hydrolase [Bryobacteraceae bacterium]
MSLPVIVFDVDGVLVDVNASYREAIAETIRHFTGVRPDAASIQQWKLRGGYNNDWVLCHHYCRELGVDVPYEHVVGYFNRIFFGEDGDGLISREVWVPENGLLRRLARRYRLALFTGRNRAELAPTLQRFAAGIAFDPVITADDVTHGKPAPEGLFQIARRADAPIAAFLGDTIDDAASARAAGVPFIGVASAGAPHRSTLVEALRQAGAVAIIENVNEIEEVLPQ